MERIQIADGVYVTTLDAEKFNRCRITVHLRYPANRASATEGAVLPLVLERGYAGCPDMTALSRKLAGLYGADLGVDLGTAGTDRILTADICGIKDTYALHGENLTAEYAEILFGVLFEPYLVDGLFEEEDVNIEKEALIRRLEAEFNNKRLYCVRQARRRFYGDSPAGVELGGYLKEVPDVTPASLKREYERILSTASIDVMVQGADTETLVALLKQKLAALPFARNPQPFAAPLAMPKQPVQHYKEEIPGLTQAKLCMLFTTGDSTRLSDLQQMRLAMSVFGGSATSRLFKNVREKQSLCYYCGSAAQRSNGVMMVDSGIEPGTQEQVEAAVLKEWEDLKNGPITEEELEDCRLALLSGMEGLGDSLGGLENWYYGQIARGETLISPEEAAGRIRAVTVEEVRSVLRSYSYSVCYVVTAVPGTDQEGDADDADDAE